MLYSDISTIKPFFTTYFCEHSCRNGCPAALTVPEEGQFETETYAPLRIGGIPDLDRGETSYALEIPGGLSLLTHGHPALPVTGLNDIARDRWPPVVPAHVGFQVMVAIGAWLALLAIWAGFLWWRGRLFDSRAFLHAMFWSTPVGFIAIEAGWTVTELGRQPWIVQGVMRTSEAVAPMPGLVAPFVLFTVVYMHITGGLDLVRLRTRPVSVCDPPEPHVTGCRRADQRGGLITSGARRGSRGPDCLAAVPVRDRWAPRQSEFGD